MNDKDIEERLHMMFQRKLLKMWREDPPPISPEGMYDTAHRIKNAQKWMDYVGSLEGHILDWKDAINHDQGVLFHNPGEHPEDFSKIGVEPTYILLPEEMALKILTLGDLP